MVTKTVRNKWRKIKMDDKHKWRYMAQGSAIAAVWLGTGVGAVFGVNGYLWAAVATFFIALFMKNGVK